MKSNYLKRTAILLALVCAGAPSSAYAEYGSYFTWDASYYSLSVIPGTASLQSSSRCTGPVLTTAVSGYTYTFSFQTPVSSVPSLDDPSTYVFKSGVLRPTALHMNATSYCYQSTVSGSNVTFSVHNGSGRTAAGANQRALTFTANPLPPVSNGTSCQVAIGSRPTSLAGFMPTGGDSFSASCASRCAALGAQSCYIVQEYWSDTPTCYYSLSAATFTQAPTQIQWFSFSAGDTGTANSTGVEWYGVDFGGGTCAALPDLTAFVADASLRLGDPVVLTGTITNASGVPTSAGAAIFQTNYSATSSTWGTTGQISMPALSGGQVGNMTTTLPASTFSAPGTYAYRLCADLNSSWVGSISESNENNNCYTGTLTVSAAIPSAPTNLQYACNPSGTEATLSWTPGPGSTFTHVRLDDPTNNQSSCVDGWYCIDPPDRAFTTGQTTATVSIVPNRSYNWWVHSANDAGASPATSAGFSCPNTAQLSCSVSNATPAVGESVRFSASGGSPSYTWTFAEGGSQTTATSYLDRSYATPGTYGVTLSKSGYTSDTCPLVTVGSPCGSSAIDLVAQQSRVKSNAITYLTWTIPSVESGVTSCVVTSSAQPSWNRTIPISACGVVVTGTGATHPITTQTTFTLTCGSRTDSAIVNILPVIDEI